MKTTYRSPWNPFAALIQAGVGGLFALIILAPEASFPERVAFGAIGAILLIGAFRSLRARVVQMGSDLTIHGYLSKHKLAIASVRPEVVNDKILAVWAPVVFDAAGEEITSISLLAGYSTPRRPNRRVSKACERMSAMAALAQGAVKS